MKSKIMPLKNVQQGGADVFCSCETGRTPTCLPPEGVGICWQVKRLQDLQTGIFLIRDSADAWETNYFISDDQAVGWINHDEITGVLFSGSFFILRERKEFLHLYFVAAKSQQCVDDLFALQEYFQRKIVSDLVGETRYMREMLTQCRFFSYMTLTRMVGGTSSLICPGRTTSIDFARQEDVHPLLDILYENMDPICEQIPTDYELAAAIQKKQILVYRPDEMPAPAAFLFFERHGVTCCLRYWVCRKKWKNQGIGSALYRAYIQENRDAKRFLLWVRDDNQAVKSMYQAYGMRFDQLHDEVMVYEAP